MTTDARRDLAAAWREVALLAIKRANELDPPISRAVCNVCGEETRVPGDAGNPCRATTTTTHGPQCVSLRHCTGTYRPDETRAQAAEAAASVLPIHDKPIGPRPAGLREPVISDYPVCTCDQCGMRINGRSWDGEPCNATKEATLGGCAYTANCTGTFRAPTVTLRDGADTIEVPEATLAAHAAVQAFAEEQDDEWQYPELDALDIASTYRGAR